MEDKERSTKYNIPGFEVISNSNYQILINIFELDHIKLGIQHKMLIQVKFNNAVNDKIYITMCLD